ncbi:hypothetical protein Taro_039962 [Colocasia esculenta]|uniref:Uncharacterized protein n=1 Tax=Colocasia esculenta TaxID=4460 RepID=A0A843WRN2_COLES|nr:hypothetical protein [Colocasia esculenta]
MTPAFSFKSSGVIKRHTSRPCLSPPCHKTTHVEAMFKSSGVIKRHSLRYMFKSSVVIKRRT